MSLIIADTHSEPQNFPFHFFLGHTVILTAIYPSASTWGPNFTTCSFYILTHFCWWSEKFKFHSVTQLQINWGGIAARYPEGTQVWYCKYAWLYVFKSTPKGCVFFLKLKTPSNFEFHTHEDFTKYHIYFIKYPLSWKSTPFFFWKLLF